MSEEELRAKISELEKENKQLKDNEDIFKTQIKEKDDTIATYLNDIKELKLKNYDLFIQIPQHVEVNNNDNVDNEETSLSVNDIIENMKGEI